MSQSSQHSWLRRFLGRRGGRLTVPDRPRHTPRTQPRLEPLEERALLSCDVFARDGTLFIRGDDAANVVSVAATGARVSVTCDNAPAMTFDGIGQVVADLGAGNDTFDAALNPPPASATPPAPLAMRLSVQGGLGADRITSRMGVQPTPFLPSMTFEVNADGGAGNDVVSANAFVHPAAAQGYYPWPWVPEARFTMSLNGGLGDDDVSARMGIEPTPFLPVTHFNLAMDGGLGNDILSVNTNVDPGALVGFNPQPEPPAVRINVDLRGGDGADRITSRMGVEPTPFLPPVVDVNLTADGGVGNDVLDAEFRGAASRKVGLRATLLGGDGDDTFRLLWTRDAFETTASADGGAGFDTGLFSPGVRAVSVEQVG